jgi:hypothetical protein
MPQICHSEWGTNIQRCLGLLSNVVYAWAPRHHHLSPVYKFEQQQSSHLRSISLPISFTVASPSLQQRAESLSEVTATDHIKKRSQTGGHAVEKDGARKNAPIHGHHDEEKEAKRKECAKERR